MPVAGLLDHQESSATPHGMVDHLERRDKKVVKVVGLPLPSAPAKDWDLAFAIGSGGRETGGEG